MRNKLQQAIDKNGELTDELMDGVTAMMISESRTVTPRLQVQNQISEYVYARTVSNLQTDLTHILRINDKVSENMREYASGVVSSKEWSCNLQVELQVNSHRISSLEGFDEFNTV